MVRHVRWRGLEAGTTEVCRVEASLDGVVMSGMVDGSRHIEYEIRLDTAWRFSALRVLTHAELAIDLRRDRGTWFVGRMERPDLADARDIDLSFSPATNTLPIRRLGLRLGESADIVTAYIADDLAVLPDPQRYTRLGDEAYLYESRDSDFSRIVTVDHDGLFVDYPGLFTRVDGES